MVPRKVNVVQNVLVRIVLVAVVVVVVVVVADKQDSVHSPSA